MAAFAALIGGAGQAAHEYGHQVRGLLEQRRGHFVDMLTNLMMEEHDPARRAPLAKLIGDISGGGDIADIIEKGVPLLQKHFESTARLAQMTGYKDNTPPTPPPGPAKGGQVPGAQVQPASQGSAALPASSIVQAQQQSIQPVSPVGESKFTLGDTSQEFPSQAPQPAPQAEAPTGIQSIQASMGLPTNIGGTPTESLMRTGPGRAMLAPFLSNQAKFQEASTLANMEVQRKQASLNEFMKSPEWGKIMPTEQARWRMWASTPGAQMPSMYGMGSAMTPVTQEMDATTFEHDNPGLLAKHGIDPAKTPKIKATYNKMSLLMGDTTPMMVQGINPGVSTFMGADNTIFNAPKVAGPVQGALPASAVSAENARHQVTGPSGQLQYLKAGDINKGSFTNPQFAPVSTTHPIPVQTVDENGNEVTKLVDVTSTSQRGVPSVPGATPAPRPTVSGAREFERPLTPLQHVTEEQKLGQYNIALDRMTQIQKQLPLLNSMLQAGKLNLEMDSSGLVRAIVNRVMPLTEAEANFVGNFRTIMEDINLLRGPMGATGFRGPEAWAALQAQRGQLLANPMITKQILANSIASLKAQQGPLAKKLRKGGPETATPTHRYNPATGKIEPTTP